MTGTPDYLMGDDAAIVIGYGTADQTVIAGLTELTLPEYASSMIEVSEFRKLKISFAGEHSVGNVSYGGNLVLTDEDGQGALKAAWYARTKLNDVRFYLNNTALSQADFMTVDLANDSTATFQVTKCAPGQISKNNTIPYSGEMAVGGRIAYFFKHYIDGASPAMGFTADTITGVPEAMGVLAGDSIIVEDSTSNDGQYLVASVATTTVTLSGSPGLTVEDAIEGTVVHAGRL